MANDDIRRSSHAPGHAEHTVRAMFIMLSAHTAAMIPVTTASVAGHSMSSIVMAIAASIPKIVQSKGCVCACDTTITVSAVAGSDSCSSKRSSKTSITRPWH
eukprot:16037-Heterococcus_DN1.PRE.1